MRFPRFSAFNVAQFAITVLALLFGMYGVIRSNAAAHNAARHHDNQIACAPAPCAPKPNRPAGPEIVAPPSKIKPSLISNTVNAPVIYNEIPADSLIAGNGRITGRVKYSNGEAASGIRVSIASQNAQVAPPNWEHGDHEAAKREYDRYFRELARYSRATVTDGGGSFEFAGIDQSLKYMVLVGDSKIEIQSCVAGTGEDLAFILKLPALVEGIVRREDGEPLGDFTISLEQDHRGWSSPVRTDHFKGGNGEFRLQVPAGIYVLHVTHKGLQQKEACVVNMSQGNALVEVVLAKGATLAGIVAGSDGLGIAGVTVNVAFAGAERKLPGGGMAESYLDGWAGESSRRSSGAEAQAKEAEARAVAKDNLKRRAAEVTKDMSAEERSKAEEDLTKAREKLAEEQARAVQEKQAKKLAELEKMAAENQLKALRESEYYEAEDVIEPPKSKGGKVINPPSRRPSRERNPYQSFRSAVTDASGAYRIEDLPPGACVVTAYAGGVNARREITLVSGDNRCDLTLEIGGRIKVTARDTAGNAVAITGLMLVNEKGEYIKVAQLGVSKPGEAEYIGAAPGRYTATISGGNFPAITREVDIGTGYNNIDVVFEVPGTLKGRITTTSGRVPQGVYGRLTTRADDKIIEDGRKKRGAYDISEQYISMDKDGNYTVQNIRPGTYFLVLTLTSNTMDELYRQSVNIVSGENTWNIMVDERSSLLVTVSLDSGVKREQVHLSLAPRSDDTTGRNYRTSRVNENGQAEFFFLSEGDYYLAAYAPGTAQSYVAVTVRRGSNSTTLSVGPANCVMVTHVASGSTASGAGIQVGDQITSYNGAAINTLEQLATAVRSTEDQSAVSLTLVRNGAVMNLTVKGGRLGINGVDSRR